MSGSRYYLERLGEIIKQILQRAFPLDDEAIFGDHLRAIDAAADAGPPQE